MSHSPSPPPAINPGQVAGNPQGGPNPGGQFGYNTTAGVETQQGSAVNQSNPYGALTYSTSIDPTTGLPKLSANMSYSPIEQAVFNLMAGGQIGQGGTALSAINNMFGQYTQDPNLVNKAQDIVNQNTSPMNASWERFMAPQRDQLRTSLLNQGLTEGSPAFQQQMDMLTHQQNLTKGQWLAQFQPQAFQEAETNYQLPLMNVSQMLSGVQPGSITGNMTQTPGLNIGSPDFAGLSTEAQQEQFRNYQQRVQAQNNLMGGIFGIGQGAATGFGLGAARYMMPGIMAV